MDNKKTDSKEATISRKELEAQLAAKSRELEAAKAEAVDYKLFSEQLKGKLKDAEAQIVELTHSAEKKTRRNAKAIFMTLLIELVTIAAVIITGLDNSWAVASFVGVIGIANAFIYNINEGK